MDKPNSICLIFRKPRGHFFSIEKIFNQMAAFMNGEFRVKEEVAPAYTTSLRELFTNFRWARKLKADVYHITGDIHYVALRYPASRTILTVHDCGFLNDTSGLKKQLLRYLFLKWPVKHCRIITTVSERTKQQIIHHTGCPPEKIVVIPNPVGDLFEYREKVFNTENPQLLFIGSTANKNLERVIEALKGIKCELIIVGAIPENEQAMLGKNNIRYRQFIGIAENELFNRYLEADMLLFPSTHEGFGLPIIEAQQCGIPVITSNISPMKEVAGEGACLVDPLNVDSIRSGVLQLMTDRDKLREIIQKGRINVQKYSPAAIAELYKIQYHRIISKRA